MQVFQSTLLFLTHASDGYSTALWRSTQKFKFCLRLAPHSEDVATLGLGFYILLWRLIRFFLICRLRFVRTNNNILNLLFRWFRRWDNRCIFFRSFRSGHGFSLCFSFCLLHWSSLSIFLRRFTSLRGLWLRLRATCFLLLLTACTLCSVRLPDSGSTLGCGLGLLMFLCL